MQKKKEEAKRSEATKTVLKKKLAKTRWKVLRDKQGMAKVESELVKYEAMFLDLTQMLEVADVTELVNAFLFKCVPPHPVAGRYVMLARRGHSLVAPLAPRACPRRAEKHGMTSWEPSSSNGTTPLWSWRPSATRCATRWTGTTTTERSTGGKRSSRTWRHAREPPRTGPLASASVALRTPPCHWLWCGYGMAGSALTCVFLAHA